MKIPKKALAAIVVVGTLVISSALFVFFNSDAPPPSEDDTGTTESNIDEQQPAADEQNDSSDEKDKATDAGSDSSAKQETSSEAQNDNGSQKKPSSAASSQSNTSHTHKWVESSKKAATCSQNGYIDEKCSCGKTKRTTISATGSHSFSSWVVTKKATEQEKGIQERTCSNCGRKEQKEIAKLKPSVDKSTWNQEVLRLVNIERSNRGIAPLSYGTQAQSAADIRAAEIVNTFDHTRPNGTSCFTALDEAGISYHTAGENIAAGHQSPSQVVNAWMNSDGHRENILNENFTYLAVGIKGSAWVQLFYS